MCSIALKNVMFEEKLHFVNVFKNVTSKRTISDEETSSSLSRDFSQCRNVWIWK